MSRFAYLLPANLKDDSAGPPPMHHPANGRRVAGAAGPNGHHRHHPSSSSSPNSNSSSSSNSSSPNSLPPFPNLFPTLGTHFASSQGGGVVGGNQNPVVVSGGSDSGSSTNGGINGLQNGGWGVPPQSQPSLPTGGGPGGPGVGRRRSSFGGMSPILLNPNQNLSERDFLPGGTFGGGPGFGAGGSRSPTGGSSIGSGGSALANLNLNVFSRSCRAPGCSNEAIIPCLGCKMVGWCCKEHLKEDWATHLISCNTTPGPSASSPGSSSTTSPYSFHTSSSTNPYAHHPRQSSLKSQQALLFLGSLSRPNPTQVPQTHGHVTTLNRPQLGSLLIPPCSPERLKTIVAPISLALGREEGLVLVYDAGPNGQRSEGGMGGIIFNSAPGEICRAAAELTRDLKTGRGMQLRGSCLVFWIQPGRDFTLSDFELLQDCMKSCWPQNSGGGGPSLPGMFPGMVSPSHQHQHHGVGFGGGGDQGHGWGEDGGGLNEERMRNLHERYWKKRENDRIEMEKEKEREEKKKKMMEGKFGRRLSVSRTGVF